MTPALVSFTLAGPWTADIIGCALRSAAPIVDTVAVVYTGTEDPGWAATLSDIVTSWTGTRPDLRWFQWPWRDDFAAARNAALAFAAETGAAWGCMVDTDERVICPDPAALRAFLGALPDHVIVALAHAADGSHTRERFFRLPARAQFVGRTHEQFIAREDQQAIVPREIVTWSELPKTREQLRAKFTRDATMLRADIKADPNNGAAQHYLGITLQSLAAFAREDGPEGLAQDLLHAAIASYREHRRIDTSGAPAWHEGTAWSCYRAAECYLALEQPDRAIDAALAGLALDAGVGELYWIAAVASLQAGRHEQARAWATSAKAHGMGSESERRRRGFRVPRGLTTGPDEVIAAATGAKSCTE